MFKKFVLFVLSASLVLGMSACKKNPVDATLQVIETQVDKTCTSANSWANSCNNLSH